MQLALHRLPSKYNTIKAVINYSKSTETEQAQATQHTCKAELQQISKTTKSLLYSNTKLPAPKQGVRCGAPQPNTPGTFKMKKKRLKCTCCHYTSHTYNKCQWRLGIGAATTDQECHVVLSTHKNNIRGRTIDEGHNWYLNSMAHMTSH